MTGLIFVEEFVCEVHIAEPVVFGKCVAAGATCRNLE